MNHLGAFLEQDDFDALLSSSTLTPRSPDRSNNNGPGDKNNASLDDNNTTTAADLQRRYENDEVLLPPTFATGNDNQTKKTNKLTRSEKKRPPKLNMDIDH